MPLRNGLLSIPVYVLLELKSLPLLSSCLLLLLNGCGHWLYCTLLCHHKRLVLTDSRDRSSFCCIMLSTLRTLLHGGLCSVVCIARLRSLLEGLTKVQLLSFISGKILRSEHLGLTLIWVHHHRLVLLSSSRSLRS